MQVKNAAEFGEGFWRVERAVRAGNDFFGYCGIEVGTPVFDNAIGAVRRVALAAIADDRVVRRFKRTRVKHLEHGIARRESVNAGRAAGGISGDDGDGTAQRIGDGGGKVGWQRDHPNGELAEGAESHFAAAVRGADEDDAVNIGVGLIDGAALDEIAGFHVPEEARGFVFADDVPILALKGGDLHAGQQAAHAVADQHHGFAVWVGLLEFPQFIAQEQGRIAGWIAGGVGKNPALEAAAQHRVGFEFVDGIAPHAGRGDQPVNEDEGDTVRIEGLKLIEPCDAHSLVRLERSHESVPHLGIVGIVGERGGIISIKGAVFSGNVGLGFHGGVDQREQRLAALEFKHRSDRGSDADSR